MDGPFPYLLGHYECVDVFLRHRNRAHILPMGIRLAATFHCGGQSTDIVWTALEDWLGFWHSDCMERGKYGVLPCLLLVHEMEEAERDS